VHHLLPLIGGEGFDGQGHQQGLGQAHSKKRPRLTAVTAAGAAQMRIPRIAPIGISPALEGVEDSPQFLENDLGLRQRAGTSGDVKRPP
jgi:hypothetical protein